MTDTDELAGRLDEQAAKLKTTLRVPDEVILTESATMQEAAAALRALRAAPCKWGGGNDILACLVCGLEYDYRASSRPPCGAQATIAKQAEEIAGLRKNMKPLANFRGTQLDDSGIPDDARLWTLGIQLAELTIGHLRRARSLAQGEGS